LRRISDETNPASSRVCPVSRASFLATGARRLLHNPRKILSSLVQEGDTVLDLGCGPGFFSLEMARLVGGTGKVIAVDLQPGMLKIVRRRAQAVGLQSRIRFHECQAGRIRLDETVDFALAFYMVHEVPDAGALLKEMYGLLKPDGRLLLVEPKFHVSASEFDKTVEMASGAGFGLISSPHVFFSRSALLGRG
jgi:ubiquinone/menaquinone biosynthesis C-methylase UbiE